MVAVSLKKATSSIVHLLTLVFISTICPFNYSSTLKFQVINLNLHNLGIDSTAILFLLLHIHSFIKPLSSETFTYYSDPQFVIFVFLEV